MENDLISRSALLADIEDTVVISARNTISAEMRGIHKVTDRIKAAPAVDAVEVVRCDKCKWLYDGPDEYCCLNHSGLVRITPNSFCSYGERKDNG